MITMKQKILLSSYSTNNYNDISIIDYNKGKLSATDVNLVQGNNPSYLKYDANYVYSIAETEEPVLYCYDLAFENVFMKKIPGLYPCHINITGNYIFISNYGSGDVVVCDKRDGSVIDTIKLENNSHAHSTLVYDNTLLIADLGANCIWALDKAETKRRIPIEGGPRQILLYKNGIITVEENSNTVTKFDKNLNMIKKGNTLSNDKIQSVAGGAFLLSDESLLVANRGANTITHLSQDLDIINEFDCHGNWPRYIHANEENSVVLVCNQRSGELISMNYLTGEILDSLSYPGISFCSPFCQ